MAGPIRDGRDEALDENAEINVVPFIDIMLVLLIIFMVAAPLATVDFDVDLPASNAVQRERPDEPVFLTLREDLSLALGEKPITRDGLGEALDAATGDARETRILLRADRSVAYGDLMEVMNRLRAAGYLSLALVGIDQPTPTPQGDNLRETGSGIDEVAP